VRRPAFTLLLLSCLTFAVAVGRPAITDSDEAFYAETAREMVESGDWLTPHFNYADRWEKPPLYYWLAASLYLIVGPEEWAARGWAALSGIGLVLLTWRIGRQLINEEVGWLAGAIVATSFGYFFMARAALPDLPLAFLVTATIWAAIRASETADTRARGWLWIGAGATAGLGFMTKGPVALVVPAVVLLPLWWNERRRIHLRWSEIATAGAVGAIIGLPWYVAMTLEHGAAYFESFFLSDNLARFTTDRFNEPRALWYYLPILLGGLLPWTAFLVLAPAPGLADFVRRRRQLVPVDWRLLLWIAMPLAFFTLSIGKQPRYILSVLPPLAIILARSLLRRVDEASSGAKLPAHLLLIATWATAGLHAGLAVVLLRAQGLFPDVSASIAYAAVAALAVGAVALAVTAARRAWGHLRVVMPAAAALLLLGILFGALSGTRPEPVERLAQVATDARTTDEPIGIYGAFVRNLIFYTGVPHVTLYDEEQVITFLRSEQRVLLAVSALELPRLERLSGVTVRTLGEVSYQNTAALRLDAMFWPLPKQDIDRVALVTNR
jgi:4-amino-4-deoxy-L-arabinose transferase-like glycosyltransferase